MKRSVPFILLIPVSVLFLFVMFFISYYGNTGRYTSDTGSLTVPVGETTVLDGPWSFVWDDFILVTEGAVPDERVRLPWQWYRFSPDRKYSMVGHATYFLKLETREMKGKNGLLIPSVDSACRVYINGELAAERGKPSASARGEYGRTGPFLVPFSQETDSFEIVLHVSNHRMFVGGISQGRIEYGRLQDVQSRFIILILGDAFLFLILLTIGIRSLLRFFQQGRNAPYVLFSIISLLFAFRVLLTGTTLVYHIFPFFSVSALAFSILFTTFLSLPLFLSYISSSFPQEFPRFITPAALLVSVALCGTALFLPLEERPLLFVVFAGFALLGGVFSLFRLTTAVKRHRPNAGCILIVAIVVLGCGLNDVLHSGGVVSSMLVMNLGIGFFGLVHVLILDSSSRKTMRELSGIHGRLRVVESLQDLFLSAAALDLVKPLRGITDVSDTLLRGSLGPITSDQLGGLSLINASSLQLANMVGDIIEFRKIQDGSISVQKRSVNMFFLMERVKAAASLPFSEKGMEFKNNIHRDEEEVYADDNLLERAFFNISRGFATFAEAGSMVVRSGVSDDGLDIQCTWEAEGVNRDAVTEAFAVFDGSEHTGERQKESVSLALAIAKRLVEIQQGTLRFCSETEEYLTLTITLPRQTGEISQETREEEAAHLDSLINLEPVLDDVVLMRNIDIMVISNDLMDLQVMKSQLASMNYNVIPMTNPEEAVERIYQKSPNLVLLDLYLQKMSGYDICGKIREKYSTSELPVILITEKEKVTDLMQGLTSGANDFLARPYHMEEFLTRVNTHIQLARINQMYSRFVPTEFLNTLGQANIVDLKLGDQVQREMTVLFVDIRAFTNLSENMSPQENFKFINSYLSRFSPMITKNHGFVDKFIGDAIMALYPGKPEDAIETALEMVEHVKVYNSHRAKCGYTAINIGIGIHTGNLILGIIGDDQRMQGTVISDAVNLASRIQDVTKLYHSSIVISQETFVKLENPMAYDFRFLGKVKVKGKAKSVSLFEIYNGESEEMRKLKTDTKNDFETAIILFAKRQFEEAEVIFEDIVEKNPNDYASQLFLDRARKFLSAEKRAFLSSI